MLHPSHIRATLFRIRPIGVLLASLALAISTMSCSPSGLSLRRVQLGFVEDVLGETGSLIEAAGSLPQSFLVGDGLDAERLFEARRRLAKAHPMRFFASVLDVSALDPAGVLGVMDTALLEALEFDGVLLIDHVGTTATALRDSRSGLWLVRVNKILEVIAEAALPAGASAESAALGLVAEE